MCKFFVLRKFEEKLNNFLDKNLSLFQRAAFEKTHEIVIIDELPASSQIEAEDIFYVDENSISVFEKHINCYK